MRHKAIDRFNAAAAAFTAEALDCAAELELVVDSMKRAAGVASTMGALDFAPAAVQQRDEERATGATGGGATGATSGGVSGGAPPAANDGEVEAGLKALFDGERQVA